MTSRTRNEDRLSGALKAALAQSTGVSSDECPDPSVLAAYVERALLPPEQAALDEHVSMCARCQMTVAAEARGHEPEPRRGWAWPPRQAGWRWAVPAAAAATALGVWLTVEPPLPEPTVETIEEEVAAVEGRPAAESPRQAETTAPLSPRSNERQDKLSAPDDRPARQGRLAGSPAGSERDRSMIAPPSVADTGRAEAEPSVAPAGPPAAPLVKTPTSRLPTASAAGDAVEGTASNQAHAPAESDTRAARRDSLDELEGGMRTAPGRVAMIAPVEVSAPGDRFRWRIAGSLVQRSTDGGISWSDQPLQAGVTILAGSAPSILVAWLAGTAGTVYRTVDGTTWSRLPAPTTDDLVGIQAVSSDEATVTSRDGRRFATADGGKTWAAR